MKIKVKINLKQKELDEYLCTEQSTTDFAYCIANNIEWNSYLKGKGLIEEKVEYVKTPMPEIYPLRKK